MQHVDAVIHMSSDEVMQQEEYRKFIAELSTSTKHLILSENKEIVTLGYAWQQQVNIWVYVLTICIFPISACLYGACSFSKLPFHYFLSSTKQLVVPLTECRRANQILTECYMSIIGNFRYRRRLFQYVHAVILCNSSFILARVVSTVF